MTESNAQTEKEEKQHTLKAWRETYVHLSMAILRTKRSIEAEKAKLRYMLTEIIDNVNPDGTLKDEDYENSASVPIPWSVLRKTAAASVATKGRKVKVGGVKQKTKIVSNKSGTGTDAGAEVNTPDGSRPVKKRGRKPGTGASTSGKKSGKKKKVDDNVKSQPKLQLQPQQALEEEGHGVEGASRAGGDADDDALSFQKLFSPSSQSDVKQECNLQQQQHVLSNISPVMAPSNFNASPGNNQGGVVTEFNGSISVPQLPPMPRLPPVPDSLAVFSASSAATAAIPPSSKTLASDPIDQQKLD